MCRRAAAGGEGATIIQVRLKDAPPREVLALARALVGALAVPVIVNDRVDVALAAGAAGAHLGQEDPPLDRLRPHVPPDFLLGLDRKSTRLNSSHITISYAVFCLKKKKTPNIRQHTHIHHT